MLGNLINVAAIVFGSVIGLFLGKNLKTKFQEAAINAGSLALLLLGFQMGLETNNFLIMIISLTIGSLFGEWLNIDLKMDSFGQWVESKLTSGKEGFYKGFVYASLLFCIGPMGIMGSIQSGLVGDHSVLITKAVIDGIFAIVLSVTMGWGVIGAAVSVLIYQGAIVLGAQWVQQFFTTNIINEMTATGGMLIVAIALSLLEVKKFKTANMLPSLFIAALLAAFLEVKVGDEPMALLIRISQHETFNLFLLCLFVLLACLLIYLYIRLLQMEERQRTLFKGSKGDLESMLLANRASLNQVMIESQEIREKIVVQELTSGRNLRRIGLVRYDAFKESNGNMSYSLALLNDSGSGVLITGIFTQEQGRSYIKAVRNWGPAENAITEEEEKAIKLAYKDTGAISR